MFEIIRKLQHNFILIILIILFIIFINTNCETFVAIENKPYIWLYWDNIDGTTTPAFIELCRKTVYKKCSKNFNIILLNKDNIIDYIPEIKQYDDMMKNLIIAHKVDIYRIMLLHKYGGIYLDSDTIVMQDLSDIIIKLNTHDFVGFGCTGNICKNGYGNPSNWILAANPNSKLMKTILNKQLLKLYNNNNVEYHDFGKLIIWDSLKELIENDNYQYYHYPSTVDGTRDKDGYWITSEIVFSDTPIHYDDDSNFLFYVFYNSGMDKSMKVMTQEELLDKKWNFTKYLKKALL